MKRNFWLMFVTSLRTEQLAVRRNPLLFVNSALLPAVLLLITLGLAEPVPDRTMPVLWGAVLTSLWGSTVWMAGGVLRRERTSGTLGRVVTGAHDPFVVLLGKSLGATLYAIAIIAATAAVTVALIGVPTRLGEPGTVAVAMLVLVASATALGTLLACLFLVTRHGLEWSSTLVYPVFLLGGLLIPPALLAPSLRWVPDVLSLHWVHQMLVATSRGEAFATGAFLAAAGLAVLYAVAAYVALHWAVTKARRQASLDLI
jgi:ABC-type multidrug transport system permease subunit